jgi:hypothetical protein
VVKRHIVNTRRTREPLGSFWLVDTKPAGEVRDALSEDVDTNDRLRVVALPMALGTRHTPRITTD